MAAPLPLTTDAPARALAAGLLLGTGVAAVVVVLGTTAALALAALAPLLLLAPVVQPRHLLYAALLIVPLWVPVSAGGRSVLLPPSDFVLAAMTGMAALGFVLGGRRPALLAADVFFLGFLVCGILSFPSSTNLTSFAFSVKTEVLGYAAFRFATVLVTTRPQARTLLLMLTLAELGLALGFFSSFVAAYSSGGIAAVVWERGELVRVPWATSNSLGACLALPLPAAAALVLMRGPVAVRVIAALTLGVGSAAVVLSASRGATLGLLASAAVFLWVNRRQLRTVLVAGVLAAALGAVAATSSGVLDAVIGRFETAGTDASSLARLGMWRAHATAIVERPLLGHGLDNVGLPFTYAYGYGMGDAHNVILKYAQQVGLLGLAFKLALFGVFVRLLWRTRRRAPQDPALYGAFAATFAGMAVNAMVESVLSGDRYLTPFMAVMGLLVAWAARPAMQADETPPAR